MLAAILKASPTSPPGLSSSNVINLGNAANCAASPFSIGPDACTAKWSRQVKVMASAIATPASKELVATAIRLNIRFAPSGRWLYAIMRLWSGANNMTTLKVRFDNFMSTLGGVENLDTLMRRSNLPGRKSADYLAFDRRVIIEQKSLEVDPDQKVQSFINDLIRERGPLAPGDASLTSVARLLEGLPDGYSLKKGLYERLTRGIEDILARADKQTADTRQTFALPPELALGMVIILNENAQILEPDYVVSRVWDTLCKRSPKGELRYQNNEVVILISEGHRVLTDGAVGWQVGLADGRILSLSVDNAAAQRRLTLYDVVLVRLIEGKGKAAVRAELRVRPVVQGTVVVLENKTGRILAMSGGFSYPLSQLNRATQAVRQPGSAIKPLSYLAALGKGLQPNTLISDSSITFPPINPGRSPRN
jgi:Penicillin binding protein transpeptidase domain